MWSLEQSASVAATPMQEDVQLLKVALLHLGSTCGQAPQLMQQLLAPLARELLDPERTVVPDVRKNAAAALQAGVCAACASAAVSPAHPVRGCSCLQPCHWKCHQKVMSPWQCRCAQASQIPRPHMLSCSTQWKRQRHVQASPVRPAWHQAAGLWLQREVAPALDHFVACAFPFRRDTAEAALPDSLASGPSVTQIQSVGKFAVGALRCCVGDLWSTVFIGMLTCCPAMLML